MPPRTFSTTWEHFLLSWQGQGCCWHLVIRSQGCCETSYKSQDSLTTSIIQSKMPIVVRSRNLALCPPQEGKMKGKERGDAEKEVGCYLDLDLTPVLLQMLSVNWTELRNIRKAWRGKAWGSGKRKQEEEEEAQGKKKEGKGKGELWKGSGADCFPRWL